MHDDSTTRLLTVGGRYRIYTLCDPQSGAVRYVGITRNTLARRLIEHIGQARRSGEKNHRTMWLRSLDKVGVRPAIVLVEETDDPARECFWIAHYRESGADLVNLTDGGESHLGYVAPQSVRDAISAAHRGRAISAEHLAALIRANTGREFTPEHRAKLSAALRGRQYSEATRRKIGDAQRGKPGRSLGRVPSAEHRAKLATANRGKKQSEETRAKIGAALRGKPGALRGRPWSEARRAAHELAKQERSQ